MRPIQTQDSFDSSNVLDDTFGTSDSQSETALRNDEFPDIPFSNDEPESPLEFRASMADSIEEKPMRVTAAAEKPAVSPVGRDETAEADSSSNLVGVQGQPVDQSSQETAQTAAPIRPPVPPDNAFDFGNIDSFYWWLLLPLVLVPLLLFRFVMGTSSSDDLARYKYSGPTVRDPDAPNVRGRFKKRSDSSDSKTALSESSNESESNPDDDSIESHDLEDDLSFLDKVPESDQSIDVLAPVLEEPVEELTHLQESLSSHTDSELAAASSQLTQSSLESDPVNSQSESDVDFDFFSDDDETQLDDKSIVSESTDELDVEHELLDEPSEQLGSADSSSDAAEEFTMEPVAIENNSDQDSDDDFDFFSDDDETQLDDKSVVAESRDESDVEHELLNESSAELGNNSGSSSDDAEEFTPEPIATENSSDQDSDEDFDFFGDDDDDGFNFEDENEEAVAVVEDNAAELNDELAADASDNQVDLEEPADEGILEPALAATAAASVATVVAAKKGGSWMSRLFGGRKAKKTAVQEEEIAEEDAIAATAIENADSMIENTDTPIAEDTASEEDSFAEIEMQESAADQSNKLDFSDSSEAFSLTGDDSSDGMFDDDSDANYEFDAETTSSETVAVVEDGNSSVAEESADDFEAMWSDDDEEVDMSLPGDSASTADQSLENDHFDSEIVSVDLSDSASTYDVVSSVDGASEPEVSVSEPEVSVSEPEASVSEPEVEAVESSEYTEDCLSEFSAVAHPAGREALPLLEDQLLDDIVGADDQLSATDDGTPAIVNQGPDDSALLELQERIAELESQQTLNETERVSLKTKLGESLALTASLQADTESQSRVTELEEKLKSELQSKEELESKLVTESELHQQALASAEEARAEIEIAKAAAEEASAKADQAIADATEARMQADEALAAKAHLEKAAAENDSAGGMATGSLLAAAGGAVVGAVASSSVGDAAKDDPFHLEPEQVKTMLKKLKSERKKRLKTKEYFLAADAKRREIAGTLQNVTGELEALKLQFQQVADSPGESVSKDFVNDLKSKLDSAEKALKKKKPMK